MTEPLPKLVVLTGAGMSAESGIATFRDAGGLWDRYPVMDVASAEGFARNPELIHEFYNERRRQLVRVQPNKAHLDLAALERDYDVWIVTQNVDNLHERAGSTKVLHLHGELMKVRSMRDESRIYTLPDPSLVTPGDHGPLETTVETRDSFGSPVRPHIVFFQEAVPNIEPAVRIVSEADVLVIIGTTLNVYPAAGLIHYARPGVPVYYIDPRPGTVPAGVTIIQEPATKGVAQLIDLLKHDQKIH